MKKKVLITPRSFSQSGEKARKLLEEQGYEIRLNSTGKTLAEEQMRELCADVDGVIVGIDPVTEPVLENAVKLKAISKYGAGLDNINLEAAARLGIKVERAAGTNAVSVAELAIGMFFALARNITALSNSTKSGGWDRVRGVELSGKTAGILGMGCIGREAARMASGIGMKVIAYDPYAKPDKEYMSKYGIEMKGLEEVIREADFLTLHLPLTEETRHIINKAALEKMKPSAYIVNTSRGELVDEEELYEALAAGVVAGAAEDVFSKEPPGGHRLLSLDNFILTSHVGAYTVEANEKMALKSAMNLIEILEKN